MPNFKNFDHHMAQLTLLHDIELADGWAEHFDHTVSEEELQDGQICDAEITFAINLWRSGEEDYANATPPEYKAQLKGCWARRVDLSLKEVSSIYPQAEDLTISDIEREVQAT